MKSLPFSVSKSKYKKLVRFATSAIAALSLIGGINTANAAPGETPTVKEINSVSISTAPGQTQPVITNSVTRQIPYQTMGIEPLIIFPVIIIGGCIFFGGLVVIGEREVGIVVRKFTFFGKVLPPNRLIALNGEAGLQADTLAPGWHWGYWPWQYAVKKEPVIIVPQGEIALIVAADGASNPPERILGKIVECDNFQDARKFLTKGGEKGRQIAFITAGTYRINTALFKVITTANATTHGMRPEQLRIYEVAADKVGIVTTLDGSPIP
ncbi:MAG: flotillin family protein, partial [Dolichospermum sp.]